MIEHLNLDAMRPKVQNSINKYLSLSKNQSITVGFYHGGKLYVFGNTPDPCGLLYDVGSISKTFTAHLILKLSGEGKLSLDKSVSDYVALHQGDYPTLYELLTHTAGYWHLTPAEITVPALLRHGYARRNIYENAQPRQLLIALKDVKRRGNTVIPIRIFHMQFSRLLPRQLRAKTSPSLLNSSYTMN